MIAFVLSADARSEDEVPKKQAQLQDLIVISWEQEGRQVSGDELKKLDPWRLGRSNHD